MRHHDVQTVSERWDQGLVRAHAARIYPERFLVHHRVL